MQHSWPGNVRELIHVVERSALLKEGDVVTTQDLEIKKAPSPRACGIHVDPRGEVQVDFAIAQVDLEDVTRQIILKALEHVKWNRAEAAKLLGVSRETLRYRIEKFNLQPYDLRQATLADGERLVVSRSTDLTV